MQVFSSQELKAILTLPQLHQGIMIEVSLGSESHCVFVLADINTIDWSSDSKFLLTGSSDSTIKVIDVKKQAVTHHFSEIHTGLASTL